MRCRLELLGDVGTIGHLVFRGVFVLACFLYFISISIWRVLRFIPLVLWGSFAMKIGRVFAWAAPRSGRAVHTGRAQRPLDNAKVAAAFVVGVIFAH